MPNTYGDWLKAQREAQGLTQQALADKAMISRSHLAHIEAGRRFPCVEDARRLDKALNTGDVLTSFLPEEEATVADRFEAARRLEQQATMIREFASTLVPGILQTEPYMRAVFATAVPPWSEEECASIVSTRLERAKILDDPIRPLVLVLLGEAVLRCVVGGPAVMADQIMHIVRLSESRRVHVHVLPNALGAHSLQAGMLTLMRFDDQPPVAYTAGLYMAKLHESPDMVERILTAYDLAWGDALPQRESEALMRSIAEEYRNYG